jgi:multiple sugar transport system permease protein
LAVPTTRTKLRVRESLIAYLFILPMLIGLVFFTAGPVLYALGMSFTKWDIVNPPIWVGGGNYYKIFTTSLARRVMWNTLYYTVLTVPVGVLVSLLAALATNRKVRGVTFYRSVFFLPVVTSSVAVAYVFGWLYNRDLGLINYILRSVGLHGPPWLGSTKWAMPAVAIMSIWQGFGYNMVLFLAGLQGIPVELYEAAQIDGAGRCRSFLNVTWPMLSPVTFLIIVITVISSFQVFDQTYILTDGGPAYSTLTIALYIYREGFQSFNMGYAAAVAYVLFVIILLATLLQFRLQQGWTHYEF